MRKKSEDLYLKNKHTVTIKNIPIEFFTVNGTPVCLSWYGCNKHRREACVFLVSRRFGTVLVCGLTGEDIPQESDKINPIPLSCPLHQGGLNE